ncbi:rhamnan synthesis F family protein [Cohnella yongneupensis]|uniref:Rhamnan synthesis F family protein n=1 Tax=Cohnella yongneupensis TaxID=425006 RepID=A0ABW0QVF2_9BACL
MTKRLGFFHIHNIEGIVHDYVAYLLDEVARNVDHLVIVSSDPLQEDGVRRLTDYTEDLFVRDRYSSDSAAFKDLLSGRYGWDKVRQFDELVIVNDTCYGPLYSLKQVFDEMDRRSADFWGVTNQYPFPNPWGKSSTEKHVPYHVQSYFLVVKRSLLQSEDFKRFWDSLGSIDSREDSLLKYEARFTSYFTELGYTSESYIDTFGLTPTDADNNILHMHHNAHILTDRYKCPFVKCESFAIPLEQSLNVSVGADMRKVADYVRDLKDYDVKLIWDHLLSTLDVSDLHDNLHLDYLLPSRALNVSSTKVPCKKAVVIAHLHYPELVETCFSFLRQIPSDIDLIITTKMTETKEKIEACMSDLNRRNYRILMSTNRGREISSLLVSCKAYLTEYEYLCFVHDKKVTSDLGIPKIGQDFMNLLWENTLKSPEYILNVLNCFDENPRLGLLGPPAPYHATLLSSGVESWTRSFPESVKLAERLKLNCKLSKDKRPFVLGTAFWCRTSALRALFEYGFEYEDFPPEPLPGDGSMNHAIERILPYVAQHQGYYSGLAMPAESAEIQTVNYRYLFASMMRRMRQGSIMDNYASGIDLHNLLDVFAIEERFSGFYRKHSKILLYGTGEIAERFAEDFNEKGLKFDGFVLSDGRRGALQQFLGFPVYELSEIKPSRDTGIILAISRSNQKQVFPLLNAKGFENVFSIYS